MRVYILKDEDFERLKTELSRDPQHGLMGGGSAVLSDVERKAFEEAHNFYWYHVLRWMDTVKGKSGGNL